MPSTLDCPSCGHKLEMPAGVLLSEARCPRCSATISSPAEGQPEFNLSRPDGPVPKLALDSATDVAQDTREAAPGSPAPPAPSGQRITERPVPAGSQEEERLGPCPFCGKPIRNDAATCRYCRADIPGRQPAPEEEEDERPWEQRRPSAQVRRDCEPHRASLVLTLGIMSIATHSLCGAVGLPLGIIAWVIGRRDEEKMRTGVMDPDGEGMTKSGRVCGIVGTILSGLYLMGCLVYLGFVVFVMYSAASLRPSGPPPAAFTAPAPVPGPMAPVGSTGKTDVVIPTGGTTTRAPATGPSEGPPPTKPGSSPPTPPATKPGVDQP
jgi:hypothetical protein